MVRFTDGTLHLCRVLAWQRRGDGWIVALAWGDSGTVRDEWFVHEAGKVAQGGRTKPQ